MHKIIDGKKIQREILKNLGDDFLNFQKKNKKKARLSIFVVGENSAVNSFVKIKKEVAENLKIDFNLKKYQKNISEDFLISEIKKESENSNGIIIQLPLPEKFNREKILNLVSPEKDVDLLTDWAWNRFLGEEKVAKASVLPPVAGAVWKILKKHSPNPSEFWQNKKVLILGKGKLVGSPVSILFQKQKIDFNILDLNNFINERLKKISEADLIISGTGKANLIKKEMIKKGVFLIDAGTSTSGDSLVGDISLDCLEKASYFSKTPGGVGPITVAILYENFKKLIE